MERDQMTFDVVVVGAGPSGLAAAIHLAKHSELSVCVLEKSAEIGGHILSGAVIDPQPLQQLLSEEELAQAPLGLSVTDDDFFWLDQSGQKRIPDPLVPGILKNQHGYRTLSLANLCRYLSEVAESYEVEIFPGFPASHLLYHDDGSVAGVQTGDMGVDQHGNEKADFAPGIELRATHTLLAEGARGHLGKEVSQRFQLTSGPQHFAIGFKELWQLSPETHEPGKVIHTLGYPLTDHDASGGGFAYHQQDGQLALGLVVDLNYQNPSLDPFMEFQRFKSHPMMRQLLAGGERIAYGARAINKSGYYGLSKMTFPGGALIGCDAGTLDPGKIKGTHTALESGIAAAQAIITKDNQVAQRFLASNGGKDFYKTRNVVGALHKLGTFWGSAYTWFEQSLLRGHPPLTFKDHRLDHQALLPISDVTPFDYPKPDGVVSFDRPSSVYLSNTYHEEDQPSHLQLDDPMLTERYTLTTFDEPAQRYCPAGVYEVVGEKLVVNGQNCIHCKTCDIKEPSQNIRWVTPEGGGGPNYPNM